MQNNSLKKRFDNSFAFTLAEVLITLGIIGVVAAMTIPTLMQKTQDKETVTAVKKAYSTLSSAYTSAVQENGPPNTWNLGSNRSPEIIRNLLPFLKVSLNCIDKTNCIYSTLYNFGGSSYLTYDSINSTVLLDNGALINGLWVFDAQCKTVSGNTNNICAIIDYDVNGLKKPNTHGIDVFSFYLTNDKILPIGTSDATAWAFSDYCRNGADFLNNGLSCTAWVLYNENLDYLHCPGLAWDSKHKCG